MVTSSACDKRVSTATAKQATTMDGMKKQLKVSAAAVDSCNSRLQRAVDAAAKVLDSVRTSFDAQDDAAPKTKNNAALVSSQWGEGRPVPARVAHRLRGCESLGPGSGAQEHPLALA